MHEKPRILVWNNASCYPKLHPNLSKEQVRCFLLADGLSAEPVNYHEQVVNCASPCSIVAILYLPPWMTSLCCADHACYKSTYISNFHPRSLDAFDCNHSKVASKSCWLLLFSHLRMHCCRPIQLLVHRLPQCSSKCMRNLTSLYEMPLLVIPKCTQTCPKNKFVASCLLIVFLLNLSTTTNR